MKKLIQTCQEKCGFSDVRDLLWVVAILLNFVVMLIFGLFSAQNFRNINTSYMFYFNIAMTTIFFYRFRDGLKKKRIYQIALIFVAWTVVCVFFNENHYIIADYFPQDLMMTLGAMCIALPFVDMTREQCLRI